MPLPSLPAARHPRQHLSPNPASARDDGPRALGGGPERIVHQMGISLGRRCLGMAQQPADDRQGQAEARQDGGVRVPQIVDPDPIDTGLATDRRPECLISVSGFPSFPGNIANR